jgi:hypothetical protein
MNKLLILLVLFTFSAFANPAGRDVTCKILVNKQIVDVNLRLTSDYSLYEKIMNPYGNWVGMKPSNYGTTNVKFTSNKIVNGKLVKDVLGIRSYLSVINVTEDYASYNFQLRTLHHKNVHLKINLNSDVKSSSLVDSRFGEKNLKKVLVSDQDTGEEYESVCSILNWN